MMKTICGQETNEIIEKILRPKNNNDSNTTYTHLKFVSFASMID